jgi:hypothetical protein
LIAENLTKPYDGKLALRGLSLESGLPKQMIGIKFPSYFGQHYGHKTAAAKDKAIPLLDESVWLGRVSRRSVPTAGVCDRDWE